MFEFFPIRLREGKWKFTAYVALILILLTLILISPFGISSRPELQTHSLSGINNGIAIGAFL